MATDWYVIRGQQRFGPFPVENLRQLASSGKLRSTDSVWREGMAKPVPATQIAGNSSPVAIPDSSAVPATVHADGQSFRTMAVVAGAIAFLGLIIGGIFFAKFKGTSPELSVAKTGKAELEKQADLISLAFVRAAEKGSLPIPIATKETLREECLGWLRTLPDQDLQAIIEGQQNDTVRALLLACADYVHRPGSAYSRELTAWPEMLDQRADEMSAYVLQNIKAASQTSVPVIVATAIRQDCRDWLNTLPEKHRMVIIRFREQDRAAFEQLMQEFLRYADRPQSATNEATRAVQSAQAANFATNFFTAMTAAIRQQQVRKSDELERVMNAGPPRCNACGGSGSYSFVDGYGQLKLKTCPYCSGTGNVWGQPFGGQMSGRRP